MNPRPEHPTVNFSIRMEPELRDRIRQEAARDKGRSANATACILIQEALDARQAAREAAKGEGK